MAKKKKHPILRVRKSPKTDRDNLQTRVIPNKKKAQKKKWCRKIKIQTSSFLL